MDSDTSPIPLLDATRDRYLHYALSVITSRALPDVRDGLKPVQRRILYGMYHNLKLTPDARYRKSAAVVGEVMAKYHPHGDLAIYEAMVRLAQPFALLHPLVDGQGNFGSLDGDNAAAMRYTEARLAPMATELLSELGARTVDYRPTYDGQNAEPIVLPAQFPQLLVNGVEGIAVGMATRIPPHNLKEILDACLLLIDKPDASVRELYRKVQGPDFPTGGEIVSGTDELLAVYTDGQGPIRLRATWTTEQRGRKHFIVLTSVPYGQLKGPLVEKLGELVAERKIPQLTDVRDESTDDVRIALELRNADDAEAAMAWLYRHTPLATTFHVNLTCLIPTDNPEVGAPSRLSLRDALKHWLDFRLTVVRRRLEHALGVLRDRIHVLEGFVKVFDALDEILRIIRASEGKKDAAQKLMARFELDEPQVEAILELKLWRLGRLEIQIIREELQEKSQEAQKIAALLADPKAMWALIREELNALKKQHGRPRRTTLRTDSPEPAYREDAYVVAEDAWVIVTRDGWIKRQSTFSSVDKLRMREGDSPGWVLRASTVATVAFFSSGGAAYVMKVGDVPATTGHGEPVQRFFTFADGESVVGVCCVEPGAATPAGEEEGGPYLIAVSRSGRVLRMPLSAHAEVSNKNGRRFMRLDESADNKASDVVVLAAVCDGSEQLAVCSLRGQGLCFPVAEVPEVKAAGKGVTALDLKEDDYLHAALLLRRPDDVLEVQTALGQVERVTVERCAGSRAGRGKRLLRSGSLAPFKRPAEVQTPDIKPASTP